MPSDQIVTPLGKAADQPTPAAAVTEATPPAPRPAWRGPTSAVGWAVGALTLLIAGGLLHVRGIAKRGLRISAAIDANRDFQDGQKLVNACLPTYEADLAAAGLKRPAPDLTIGSIPNIE